MKRVFAHIGFSVAITLIVACAVGTKIVIFITLGLAVLFIASLCLPALRKGVSVPLCAGSALFACVVFLAAMHFVVAPQKALDGTRADISFYFVDTESHTTDGSYVYTAKTVRIDSDGAPQNIKLRVKSKTRINTDCYNVVDADVVFYNIADSAFDSFGYWGDGIFVTAVVRDFNITDEKISSPMSAFLHLRQEIISAFDTLMPDEEASVATAFVTGYRYNISNDLSLLFNYSGTSHIIVVSGFHLFVVAGLLALLMQRLRLPRVVMFVGELVPVLGYMALVGFTKSIVRAGIMFLIIASAPLFRTVGDSLNSLGLAVFVICLNPFAVTDIGAQLSVLATLALIIASHSSLMYFEHSNEYNITSFASKRAISRVLSVYCTLFVVLFTCPILYLYYGYINIASVVSNVIAIPICSAAVLLSWITFGFYKLGLDFIAEFFARICELVIHFFLWCIRQIASFSGTTINLGYFFGFTIAGVLVIIAVCFILTNGVLLKRALAISAAFVVLCTAVGFVYENGNSYLYVTQGGASVLCYDDYVIVRGVDTMSDYVSVSSYLHSVDKNIDVLVADGNDVYSVMLTQQIPTNVVLTDELSEEMLDSGCYKSIELHSFYHLDMGDDLDLDFSNGDCVVDTGSLTIGFAELGSDADIILYDFRKIIADPAGIVDLQDGDVLYTIRDNTFSVRRVSKCQE